MTNQEKLKRLQRKTVIDPITGCWLWKGACTQNGYGQICFEYIRYLCHRVSAAIHLELDLLDKTQQALHKPECPNRNCWNPEHLYVGTAKENTQDITNAATYCKHNNDTRYCRTCKKQLTEV